MKSINLNNAQITGQNGFMDDYAPISALGIGAGVGLAVGAVTLARSTRRFGGVTGDVMGAVVEIATAAALATVTYANAKGEERTITIKGIDEANSAAGEVSWISPIARTLLKAREGDELKLVMPDRVCDIEVLKVQYPAPASV